MSQEETKLLFSRSEQSGQGAVFLKVRSWVAMTTKRLWARRQDPGLTKKAARAPSPSAPLKSKEQVLPILFSLLCPGGARPWEGTIGSCVDAAERGVMTWRFV